MRISVNMNIFIMYWNEDEKQIYTSFKEIIFF